MTLPSNANLPQYPAFANARSYDAEFDRMAAECAAFGEGIAPFDQSKDCTVTGMGSNKATDLEVVTGASGLTVSVALGNAWVKGDGRSTQGLYFCYVPTANVVTLPTAHATLPRVDAVVLKVEDADVSGSATQWSVTYQQGTATGGANLTNLTGAPGQSGGPSFAGSQFLLAYVLTTAAFAGPYVTATHILDRRCFAYRPQRLLGTVTSGTFLTGASQVANGNNYSPSAVASLAVAGNNVNPVDVQGYMPSVWDSGAGHSLMSLIISDKNSGVWPPVAAISAATPGYLADNYYAAVTTVNARHPHFPRELDPAFAGIRTYKLGLWSGAGTTIGYEGPIRLSARYS